MDRGSDSSTEMLLRKIIESFSFFDFKLMVAHLSNLR